MGEKKPIKLQELDRSFKYEVFKNPDGKHLFYCFQCGTCTSSCDVADQMDIPPHLLIRMAILGMRDRVLNSKAIWMCTTCFLCEERCPQKVGTTSALFAIKNIATREVGVPKGLRAFVQNVYEVGRSAEVGEFEEEDRESLGLPRAPIVNVDAVQRLFRETGMAELVDLGEK